MRWYGHVPRFTGLDHPLWNSDGPEKEREAESKGVIQNANIYNK